MFINTRRRQFLDRRLIEAPIFLSYLVDVYVGVDSLFNWSDVTTANKPSFSKALCVLLKQNPVSITPASNNILTETHRNNSADLFNHFSFLQMGSENRELTSL